MQPHSLTRRVLHCCAFDFTKNEAITFARGKARDGLAKISFYSFLFMSASHRVSLPLAFGLFLLLVWSAVTWTGPLWASDLTWKDLQAWSALTWTGLPFPPSLIFPILPSSIFPSPAEVANALLEESRNGRLVRDMVASLFRVAMGFGGAVLLGVPLGLWLGHSERARATLLPFVNFLRSLSPLAWIPFAIFWFGIGDGPAIFLIFGATLFPIVISTLSAVAAIPEVYFRVARENGCRGATLLQKVTFPAILPALVTALRVGAGLAWLVVVAAEIVAGRDGLGFLIWDARNGLRVDLLVAAMLVIGSIGIALDLALASLRRLPEVSWGHEN